MLKIPKQAFTNLHLMEVGKCPVLGILSIQVIIFNSYVKLPEGNGVHYPLVICYIAIENSSFIIDLPIKDDDFL